MSLLPARRTAAAIALLVSSAALASTAAAQTTAKPTPKPAVHRSATATAHRSATPAKSFCAVQVPEISPKIPALPAGKTCPSALYTLSYIDTEIGTGELAVPRKWYTVHYTGYLLDGTKFDSSHDHPGGEPITFPYGAHQVIPGWDTGFEGMHVGGKRRLYIPYQLAYGEAGRPPVIPAKAELVFDVELVSMADNPPQPKTPPAAPAQPAKPGDGATPPSSSGAARPVNSKPTDTANPATPPPTQNTTPDASAKPKS